MDEHHVETAGSEFAVIGPRGIQIGRYLAGVRYCTRCFGCILYSDIAVALTADEYMANWVLRCRNCDSTFMYSKVDDIDLAAYFLPVKPEFPLGGAEFQCPECDFKAIYQPVALSYEGLAGPAAGRFKAYQGCENAKDRRLLG
jgi:hypothetical protein